MIIEKTTTSSYLNDILFISCGNYGRYEIYDDAKASSIEYHLKIAKEEDNTVRLIKRNPICLVCGKPLSRNGYKVIHPNKIYTLELQKYIHRNCENSSCITSTEAFKEKHNIYTNKIRKIAVEITRHKSYSGKSEDIIMFTGVEIPRETIYHYDLEFSGERLDYVEEAQSKKIKELNILYSGR